MTVDEFHDLLDRCGGDPAAWPPGAQAGARRLLAGSAEASSALAAQQEVDGWLSASVAGGATVDFAAVATRAPQVAPTLPSALLRWGGGAAVAAALLAVGLGAATGASHATAEEPVQALAQALAAPGDAVDAG